MRPTPVSKRNNSRALIKTIDMATFKATFDSKSVDLIIDVREPGEYAEGHVPGAINIPRGLIEFKIWSQVGFPDKIDLHRKVVDFINVTAVDMRIDDWKKAGYPLVRE